MSTAISHSIAMVDPNILKRGIGDLQRSLERFENYNDGFILPDTFLVLRLDAHRYGDWSTVPNQDYPCSPRLTEYFQRTASALMASSLRIVLTYCHGDEISLFIDPVENNNPLRRSRIISILSSAAAIHFAEVSGGLQATFEARLSELPSLSRVIEYFLWQRRYCYRNAVTIALRNVLQLNGHSEEVIERATQGVSEELRVAQLIDLGYPVEEILLTTRRGSLCYWEEGVRDGRSILRPKIDARLSDSDEEYLAMITKLVQGRSLSQDQARHDPVIKAASRLPNSQSRGAKKANTSVFKL